jgi:transmembrane sensor
MNNFRARVKRFWARFQPDGNTLSASIKAVLAVFALKVLVVVTPIESPVAATPGLQGHRYTEAGHPADVVLGDSSVVLHLNGDTGIVGANSSPESREVVLERGEVQAEVKHDDLRPFRISVGRLVIQDVGTQFNVLALGETTEFSITQGEARLFERRDGELLDPEVALSATIRRREAVIVEAGDLVDVTHGGDGTLLVTKRERNLEEARRRAEWRQGLLSFKGETLDEVVKVFNMSNRTKLVIDDPELAKLRMGGVFRPTDLEGFLGLLQRARPIDVSPLKGQDGMYRETVHLRLPEKIRH